MHHAGLLTPDGSADALPGKSHSVKPPLPVQTGFYAEADDYANAKIAEAYVRPLGNGGTKPDRATSFKLAACCATT